MKKMTRREWEELEEKEELEEERVEQECEDLAVTKPIKERLNSVSGLFR